MPKTALSSPGVLGRFLRLLPSIYRARPSGHYTVVDLMEKRARDHGQSTFVRFEDEEWTYAQVNALANQVAHWATGQGVGRGTVVGLLMENRPQYLAVWLGLAKTGAVTALLNTHLRSSALAHSLRAADCKMLVLGEECMPAWNSLGDEAAGIEPVVMRDPALQQGATLPPDIRSLDAEISEAGADNPPSGIRGHLSGADPLFYIYTSGTTGLPKAARLSHFRFMGGGIYATLAGMRDDEVIYCPLPLYHTSGGVMCVNAVMRKGATLALARQFSASRFWDDIARHRATAFQYIGELCRYLVNQPKHPLERSHGLRFALGNGLQPDVWKAFQQRFGVPRMVEFYGATESNAAMLNLENRVGAVGRPFPGEKLALVRYDPDAGEILRGSDGFCQQCATDEAGELLVRVDEGKSSAGRFEGYTSQEATEKKIARNVFRTGDAWFRTDDLLRRDSDGFYYFVDRVGDTFRWKGENVSTQEVAGSVMACPGIALCAVYGVEVPGAEGRAGMAALVLEPGASLDGRALYRQLCEALPAYARPVFLRIQGAAELTGTFKLRKVELQAQGYDPSRSNDQYLYRDEAAGAFVKLDPQIFAGIQAGDIRF